jgi:hypothetical protein
MSEPDQKDFISTLARAGYYAVDQIVEIASETYADEADALPKAEVAALAQRPVAERREEIRRRGGPIAYDKFRAALHTLEQSGVLVRENYWCCRNCGEKAIDVELNAAADAGEDVRGYVFFHEQDTERIATGAPLYLRYGGVCCEPGDDGPELTRAIAVEIVESLRANGFRPEWSGSPDETITLPVDWDKLPPESGSTTAEAP